LDNKELLSLDVIIGNSVGFKIEELDNINIVKGQKYHYPGWKVIGTYWGQWDSDLDKPNGYPHGFGMVVSIVNTIYLGRFVNGILDGYGAKLYKTGGYYIGQM